MFNSPGRYEKVGVLPFSVLTRLELYASSDERVRARLKLYPIFSDNRRTKFRPRPLKDDEFPVFERIGADGIASIVASFYRRVQDDPILRPMYPEDDFEGAEQRLRSFLTYRFGGPPDYLKERGHPRLRMRHMPFAVDQAARDRWMELMRAALEEVGVEDEVARYLEEFLGGVATFLINRPG